MTREEEIRQFQERQADYARQQIAGSAGGALSLGGLAQLYNQAAPDLRGKYVRLTDRPTPVMDDMLAGFLTIDGAPTTPHPHVVVKAVVKKPPLLTLQSVVLPPETLEDIRAAMSQLKNSEQIFTTWGFSEVFEKGTAVTMLFYGTAGTGKTLAAQAIANELNAELKLYGMAEIGSSEPGGSERTIQKIFQAAKELFLTQKKQRVILFDECDSLLYDRNKVGVILGAQINALLTEIERHEGVVIFTTNRLQTLDPALERRITAKIGFPFPDAAAREAIWKRMIPKKAPLAKDVDFAVLAGHHMAGGAIKNAVLNAAPMAAYKQSTEITMEHFTQAIEKELAGTKAFQKGRATQGKYAASPQDYALAEGGNLTVDRTIHHRQGVKTRVGDNL